MSNFLTLSELTQKVIRNLSLYPGTAVQTYAEDRIADMLITQFTVLFEERFWSFNTNWYKYELLGIDGVVKENVSKDIADFSDIETVSTENNPQFSLKNLHDSTNPFLVKGDTPVYIKRARNPEKIFEIVPYEAVGTVYVRARSKPKEFFPETIIPFDSIALISGVCFRYCADDDNSSTQLQKFKEEYEKRVAQLKAKENELLLDWNDEEAYSSVNSWR